MTRRRRRVRFLAPALIAVLVAGGCGGRADDRGDASPRTIRVLAASSLTEAFTVLARRFEATNQGVEVSLSFGGSSSLVTQVREGAPADVLATADESTMAVAVDGGLVGPPTKVATNRLTIVVEPGNPKGVTALADLARPDLLVVLCAPVVPCGRYAGLALTSAGVTVSPRSLEENVKGVVAKVALGEADAGIAYETDARAATGKVEGIAFAGRDDAALAAVAQAAVVRDAAAPDLARAYLELLTSAEGRKTFVALGFR